MNTNTSKWVGFFQGLFYPIATLVVASLVTALGQGGALNGTLPVGVGLLISAILSVIENKMSDAGQGKLFGFAN